MKPTYILETYVDTMFNYRNKNSSWATSRQVNEKLHMIVSKLIHRSNY